MREATKLARLLFSPRKPKPPKASHRRTRLDDLITLRTTTLIISSATQTVHAKINMEPASTAKVTHAGTTATAAKDTTMAEEVSAVATTRAAKEATKTKTFSRTRRR